jgi:hypothetical protein
VAHFCVGLRSASGLSNDGKAGSAAIPSFVGASQRIIIPKLQQARPAGQALISMAKDATDANPHLVGLGPFAALSSARDIPFAF